MSSSRHAVDTAVDLWLLCSVLRGIAPGSVGCLKMTFEVFSFPAKGLFRFSASSLGTSARLLQCEEMPFSPRHSSFQYLAGAPISCSHNVRVVAQQLHLHLHVNKLQQARSAI